MNKNEILDRMTQICNQVDEHIDINSQERTNITYYKDLKFNKIGLGIENVYIVETPIKEGYENANNKEDINIFEIYDEEGNLIATVKPDGKICFVPEYLEKLKEIDEKYFEQLNFDDLDFEKPEELKENDVTMTKQELQERERNNIERKKESQEEEKDAEDKQEKDKELEDEKKQQAAEALGLETSEISSICTINPREKITDKYNLIDIMPEAEKYDEISIVYSSPNDKGHGNFTILGVSNTQTSKDEGVKSNTCTPLTSIEPIEGTSTEKDVISVNQDGTEVIEKQVQGLFRINSRGRTDGISVSIGNYGMMDVDYVSNVMDKEHRRATPIKTKGPENVRDSSSEVRENAGDSIEEVEREGRIFRAREEDGINVQSLDGIDTDQIDSGKMTLEELKSYITEKTIEQGEMSKDERREFITTEIKKSGLELTDGEIEQTTEEIQEKVLDESRFGDRNYR